MAQKNQNENNPLATLEAKISNALTNYETHSGHKNLAESELQNLLKAIEDKKAEIENLAETAELNLRAAESMKTQKLEIVETASRLKNLGQNAAIAIELAGLTTPDPDGEPETEPIPSAEPQAKTTPEPEQQPEPEPEAQPSAAKITTTPATSGETASEQVANVPPAAAKKDETPAAQPSEPTQPAVAELIENCIDVDGYSFKFDPSANGLVKGEFLDPQNKNWFFGAITSTKPASIGLRPSDLQHLTYTSNSDFPKKWDCHLFVIETALQQHLERPELKIKFPPRISEPEPITLHKSEPKASLKVAYRDSGLPFINTEQLIQATRCNGYSVSFVECKDYQKGNKERVGLKLKLLGEGTTANGQIAFISFDKNSTEYELGIEKTPGTGKQMQDNTKNNREKMPKHLEPLRTAAIEFLAERLPEFSSKWEDQVTYVTPIPQPTDKQPANAAAAPVK